MIDLDGTPNKSNLEANSILGVSLAIAKASANEHTIIQIYWRRISKHFTIPMMNIINGGSHSNAPIAFQEFMISQ